MAQSVAPIRRTASPPSPYRLTVAQYHAMAEAGILADGDPVELIEGVLVRKMTKTRPHALAIRRLTQRLPALLPVGWHLETQEAITTDDSEPEPDGAVIRGHAEEYQREHPRASAVGLVIEVSDSARSFRYDSGDKKRLYARAGIPVYWVINVRGRWVDVHTGPTGAAEAPDYRSHDRFVPGDRVPLVLEGAVASEVAVADLLPDAGRR